MTETLAELVLQYAETGFEPAEVLVHQYFAVDDNKAR